MQENGQKKKMWKKWLWTSLTIAWMAVIFSFSAQPAEESSHTSLGVGETVVKLLVPDFEDWSRQEQLEYLGKIDYPIRKMGHAGEYAILGFLAAAAAYTYGRRGVKGILFTWGFCALYAASDEFHQLFVPGRSAQVTDVLIDSGGALTGVLVMCLLMKIVERPEIKKHRTMPEEENDGKEKSSDFDENTAPDSGAAGESVL